jgi:hypothetical protein
MNMFTQGQSTRINAVLTTPPYNSLATSQGCVPVNLQANDAGNSASTAPNGTSCSTTITPVVTLKNWGTNNLTSVTINYTIDNTQPVSTYSWSGNLASLATVNVTLPSISTTAGTHTFTAYTTNPNGMSDGNNTNDTITSTFTVITAGQALPYTQGFESASFVPAGWQLNNPDGDITWARSTSAAKTGSASTRINNYNYQASGEVDDLIMPNLNLSTVTNPDLTFQVAYRLYTNPTTQPNYSDTLEVSISTDCGATWNTLYKKYGTNLTTATPAYQTSSFTPSSSQWRLETISLNPYSSATNAMIRFRNITQYENNLYLDDININSSTVGVTELTENHSISIYPNPGTGMFNIDLRSEAKNMKLTVYNAVGQVVSSTESKNVTSGVYTLDLAGKRAGVYWVSVQLDDKILTERIVITK